MGFCCVRSLTTNVVWRVATTRTPQRSNDVAMQQRRPASHLDFVYKQSTCVCTALDKVEKQRQRQKEKEKGAGGGGEPMKEMRRLRLGVSFFFSSFRCFWTATTKWRFKYYKLIKTLRKFIDGIFDRPWQFRRFVYCDDIYLLSCPGFYRTAYSLLWCFTIHSDIGTYILYTQHTAHIGRRCS